MKKALQNLGSAALRRLSGLLALIVGLTALPGAVLAAGGGNVQLQLTSTDEYYLYASLGFGIIAIVFAAIMFNYVKGKSTGTEKMQEVGQAIMEGAMAYLKKQVTTMAIFVGVLAFGLYFMYSSSYGTNLAIWTSVCFIAGVGASYIAGYAGMKMAVMANMRAAAAALKSPKESLETAFKSGSVAGMLTVGMGLLGASIIFLLFKAEAMKLLVGFGFGGSLAALFMRVGGGIFTKAADVGADLVGKVEAGIPEDDPRNPATIADNVGDNVGDCAGMAADVFESYEVTLVAAIVLGAATAAIFDTETWTRLILFALMARGVGIIASIIGIFLVKGSNDVEADPLKPIQTGFRGSAIIAALATIPLAYFMMGGSDAVIRTNQIVGFDEARASSISPVLRARVDLAKSLGKDPLMVTEDELMNHALIKALPMEDADKRMVIAEALTVEPNFMMDVKELDGYVAVDFDHDSPVLEYAMPEVGEGGVPTGNYLPLAEGTDWDDLHIYSIDLSSHDGIETTTQLFHIGPVTSDEFNDFSDQLKSQNPGPGVQVQLDLRASYPVNLYVDSEGELLMAYSTDAEEPSDAAPADGDAEEPAEEETVVPAGEEAGDPTPTPQAEGDGEMTPAEDLQAAPAPELEPLKYEPSKLRLPEPERVFGRDTLGHAPLQFVKVSVEDMKAIGKAREEEEIARGQKENEAFNLQREGKTEEANALLDEVENSYSTVANPHVKDIAMAKAEHQDVHWWRFAVCIIFGIIMAFAFEGLTDYYVGLHKKPVQEVGHIASAGPAPMIITGFAYGKESSVFSVFAIVLCLIGPLLIFPASMFGGYLLSFYGIALVGLGLLTTTGYILAMDTFGPISDNAQGVFEMSGADEGNPEGARAVQLLDAAGNTTKALTKGFAIATAVVAAVALFHAFVEEAHLTQLGMSLDVPEIFLGLLIGGAAPYLFSAFSINAVGRAAFELINDVRDQFKKDPGIMAGTSRPDYGRCVAIVTKAAQRELLGPGILAIAFPILVAFGFSIGKPTVIIGTSEFNLVGAQALGGFLAGSILSGQLMAVLLANSGGLWDNSKKLIEDGLHGGKGTEAHKAAIVCDTVGDPFKDTAGPALNPLIKVMNLVALLIAPVVIAPRSDASAIGITVGAVVLLAIAIWWSKRGSMADGMASEQAEPATIDAQPASSEPMTDAAPAAEATAEEAADDDA